MNVHKEATLNYEPDQTGRHVVEADRRLVHALIDGEVRGCDHKPDIVRGARRKRVLKPRVLFCP